jgi:hypothetical protein
MKRVHIRPACLLHCCWLSLGSAISLTGCLSPIATPEAVQLVEDTFVTHRSDLETLATSAADELEQSDESYMRLPDRPYYDRASVSEALKKDVTNVEFIIEEFYLPLVYISTDNPEDVHDTCTNGGRAVKQLAPHWYICKRDWN